jgi:hypothetical protein
VGLWLRAGWARSGAGDLPSLPLARRESVEGLSRKGESMGREESGNASIPAPGDGAGESRGGAAPGPRTRETVFEAEAILQTRVAVEAEAGEARSPTPVRGGKEGEKT